MLKKQTATKFATANPNPMDYYVRGTMLKYYQRRTPSLLMTWSDLLQKLIDKTIVSFRNKLRSCVAANRGTIALIALIAYCLANVRDVLRKYTRSLVCD